MPLPVLWVLSSIILIANALHETEYGPFYYPTGSTEDPLIISFGEYNTTHFFLALDITGEHWFGFGFANTGDHGCFANNTTCFMSGVDAIIYGDYTDARTAKLWILGEQKVGFFHGTQDIIIAEQNTVFLSLITAYQYTAFILRPMQDVLVNEFCWLWAQGNTMEFDETTEGHLASGHQCIDIVLSDIAEIGLSENIDPELLPEIDDPANLPEPDEPVNLPEEGTPEHLPEFDDPVHLPEADDPVHLPEGGGGTGRPPRRRPPFSTRDSNRKLRRWTELVSSYCGSKKDSCRKMGWGK